MERSCFFCTTPFQIITAIHLTIMHGEKSEVDLYIVDQFVNAEAVALKANETGIFHDVLLVKEETLVNNRNKSKFFIWPQILFSYIVIKRKAKKILQRNVDVHYAQMFMSSKAFIPRLVALYYAKKDAGTEIIYFDDGIGSYFNKDTLTPRSFDKIIRKILFGGKANSANPKKVLLYSPDLFYKAGINVSENIKIEKISKWNCNLKLKDITNTVFSYSDKDSINESILIFDSLYMGEERKNLNLFYGQIEKIAGQENVIIKKHPRDKSANIGKFKYYNRTDLPFELICQNSNMENKLLIAVATTAVITPVLLLGEEPYVLIINNISGLTSNHVNAHYSLFKEIYNHKEKFYEADTIENALAFVKKFVKMSNKNNESAGK